MSGRSGDRLSGSTLRSELERLVEQAAELGREPAAWSPKADVVETDRAVEVRIEAPGIAASDLEAAVEGDRLVVRGTKAPERPPSSARFHRMERGRGGFEWAVRLPVAANSHRGAARLVDGVLTVRFPRIAEQRARRVTIPIDEPEPTP